MNTTSLDACVGIGRALGVLDTIANPATALLFCMRASAVYLHARPAVLFFGLCWAVLFANFLFDGASLAVAVYHIPGRQICAVVRKEGRGSSFFAIAAYDTIVYLAISWRLSSLSKAGDHWTARIAALATGRGLYSVSRGMLREGQLYYFATVPLTITIVVVYRQTSGYWAAQFVALGVVIPAVMACRAFREVRLSVPSTPILPSIMLATDANGETRG
ncbi:hypothetical protein HWV62_17832 [Athelia sp. TMB]|nr:hypothetical protein HWV62_17832 [Athelia sp. TMB]